LVIDDNEQFLDLFRRYLAGHPWQVVGAVDGDSARRLAQECRPTVSLLDVMLPKEDGWEILRRWKAEPSTQNLPVIICSVLNEPQVATTLGAAGYLLKPVTQRSLLHALAPWRPEQTTPLSMHPG
jgi:Amt family ammonium transporter